MKKYLVLLLLLVSFTSFGQFVNYTNINGRYKWIAGKFDSTFTLPSGTTPSLRTGGGTGPGALFYSTSDSVVYQYTGSQWRPLHGSDTGRIQIAYVRNTTASPMTTGQVVYINGSTGNVPTIALAQNKNDSSSAMTFGFVRGAIPVNGFGWITTFGPIDGINTNAYDEGEVIYLDSIAGQFTHDKPQAPYHMVTLGYIIKKAGNGIIFTKIQNGYELEELHNVRITSPVRNNGILAYDSVAHLWKDTTLSAIGGVTGTGVSGQVSYWTGTSSQGGSATLAYTPTSQLLVNNSVTASSTIARGINATPTLTAAANNDVLVGLDVNPTFTVGAFTGVSRYGLRVTTANAVEGARFTSPSGQFLIMPRLSSVYGAYLQSLDGAGTATQPLSFSSSKFVFESGNVLINQTTDGGQRLQVTGDVLFKGSGNTSGTTALTVQNSDANATFRVLNNGVIYIGTQSNRGFWVNDDGSNTPNLAGATLRFSHGLSSQAQNGFVFLGANSTLNGTSGIQTNALFPQSFAPTSGTAVFNQILINNTINQTGGANGITRGLYVNPTLTAAADWRSIEWSNNSGWGLYGAGTANNYLAGRLGIGSISLSDASLRIGRNMTGGVIQYGVQSDGAVQSDVTTAASNFTSLSRVSNSTFTLSSITGFVAMQASIGASATVTNQYGFFADGTLTGATNNFGFYGNISSGTGRWNIYMNGTAANYMNGNLLLGSTTDGGQRLQVTGTTQLTPAANSSALTSTGYSVTGSGTTSLINLSGTWNTTGNVTAFLMNITNTASGTSSNLIDLQVGGVSQFRVLRNGNLVGTGFNFSSGVLSGGGFTNSGTFTFPLTLINLQSTFNISSGSDPNNINWIRPTINQTGGANGITRGLYINPTLTSAADWRSLEWSNNSGFGLYGAGTATNYLGGVLGIGTTSPNASAILDLTSTTKGFLPPRMTGTEAEAIGSPAAGLLVFITNGNGTTITSTGWWGYDTSGWVKLN